MCLLPNQSNFDKSFNQIFHTMNSLFTISDNMSKIQNFTANMSDIQSKLSGANFLSKNFDKIDAISGSAIRANLFAESVMKMTPPKSYSGLSNQSLVPVPKSINIPVLEQLKSSNINRFLENLTAPGTALSAISSLKISSIKILDDYDKIYSGSALNNKMVEDFEIFHQKSKSLFKHIFDNPQSDEELEELETLKSTLGKFVSSNSKEEVNPINLNSINDKIDFALEKLDNLEKTVVLQYKKLEDLIDDKFENLKKFETELFESKERAKLISNLRDWLGFIVSLISLYLSVASYLH